MNNVKAQFWSFDMIFAIIIFSFAITVLAFTWFNITNQLSIGYGNEGSVMQLQFQNLNQNLYSQGSPSTWQDTVNASNINTWNSVIVGLAEFQQNPTVLSSSKVYTLFSMSDYNYSASKEALNTGFDYYITIDSMSTTGSGINITIGRNPAEWGALTVYVSKHNAVMNGASVIVTTELWTNTSEAVS